MGLFSYSGSILAGFLLLQVLLGEILPASAKAKRSPPPESALDGQLLWGECKLPIDPAESEKSEWPKLCVKTKATTQILMRQDTGQENKGLNLFSFYSGFHLHKHVSFHSEWVRKRFFHIGRKQNAVKDDKYPRNVFVQFGNVALSKARLSLGQLDLPFGIDYRPLMEIYYEAIKSHRYWKSPRWAAKLSLDSLVSAQYELGYGSERLSADRNDPDQDSNEAVSFRGMFDISAFEGLRFVVSGYGDVSGQRRVGGGLVNVNRKGDTTVFEWVRLLYSPDNKREPYSQLFRLSYRAHFRSGTRWLGEYEDERNEYRMGTLAHDFFLPDYGLFRLGLSYNQGVGEDNDSFWFVTSAVQIAL